MDFNKELAEARVLIDSELEKRIYDKECYQERIIEAIKYSVFAGGKRLRPVMAIKCCEMFNNNVKDILPFAAAIEMIHTYSLIHDDLPAMDDDDFRRGKPTNHKLFGEAMAILAGDGLLNLAFETMAEYTMKNSTSLEDYKRYTRVIGEVGKYSGIKGMIGGQVVDLLSTYDTMDKDKLMYMYRTKTAALFQSALVAGGIIGGADDLEVECLRDYALNLGLAYQIRDDILDIDKDKAIKKLTYLEFHDLEKAKLDIEEYSSKAISCLEKLEDKDTSFFVRLTEKLISRNT